MSAEEYQQSQSGYDESAGGPGAPTPLGALEVRHSNHFRLEYADIVVAGRRWTIQA